MPSGACVVTYHGKRGKVFRIKYVDADGSQQMETLGAEREGWSEKKAQAEVLRKALEEYLELRERPRLHSVGIGEDAALSGAESEDWLRARWGKLH